MNNEYKYEIKDKKCIEGHKIKPEKNEETYRAHRWTDDSVN